MMVINYYVYVICKITLYVLENTLSSENCAYDIIKKTNSRIKFLYRHGSVLKQSQRKTLCNALIQCPFDYSCSSWNYSLSKSLKLKLQVIQIKVMRFINNSGARTSLKGYVLKELNMPNVEDNVSQLALNHVHIFFYNQCPAYLKEHFIKLSAKHKYNTRCSLFNFHVPV